MHAEERPPSPAPSESPGSIPSTLDSAHGLVVQSVRVRTGSAFLPRVPGYETLGELGRAATGVVYKARSLRDQRLVAIKMLRDGVLAGAEQFERFCNEAQILARLDHPHIIRVEEVGELDGRLYMVLHYAEGGSLAERLTRGPLPPVEAAHLIEVIARAVHHVHQKGILHRDLKPANILLARDGTPLLADFGLGKRAAAQQYTLAGEVLGTPSYMSPEQAEGKKDLRPATDVYALGAILYECLTGRPPFLGATIIDTIDQLRTQPVRPPRKLCPDLPADLEAVCLKCLEKEPPGRYASAEDLADELQRICRGEPLVLTGGGATRDDQRQRIATCVQQGSRCLDRGEYRLALLWFAEGLRLEQGLGPTGREEPHRLRIATVLAGLSRLTYLWVPPSPIRQAQFAPDGRRVLLGHEDGRWRVLIPSTGEVVSAAEGHEGQLSRVAFNPDGSRVVTGSDDGTARVWDATTGAALTPPLQHSQWVTHVAFHPDGQRVVSASADGTAWVWDPETGRPMFTPINHGSMLWWVEVSPKGRHLVTAGWDGCAQLWNASTGQALGQALRHDGWVRQAVFSHDGRLVATASDDQTARVWRLDGEPLGPPLRHASAVRRVAFSRDDQVLLTWAADGGVRAWEVATGAARAALLPPEVFGDETEQANGGRRYLECGADGVLRLWDRAGSQGIRLARERAAELTLPSEAAALRPDGALRVTVSREGFARIWDVASCEEVTPPLLLPPGTTVVAFTPDGRYLQARAGDTALRCWDLTPDPRPLDEIVRLAQVLSGRRLDAQGNLYPLEPRVVLAGWQELRRLYPATFHASEPEIRRWHEQAAAVCAGAGLWQKGAGHLRVLARSTPGDASAWAQRGRLWVRAECWTRALNDFTRATRLERGEWSFRYWRGLVRARLGDWDRAERDLGRAATLARGQWQPWYQLALVHTRQGRTREALTDLTRVLRRHPNCRSAYLLRGFLAAQLKQWQRAHLDYTEAEARGESRPVVHYQQALVCLRKRDLAGYQQQCQRLAALAQRHGDTVTEAWAAWLCVLGESAAVVDPQRVLGWADRVRQAHGTPGAPLQPFSQTLFGAALLRAGQVREAIDWLEPLSRAAAARATPWDWLLLSLAYQQLGNLRAARQWLRRMHRWMGRSAPRNEASAVAGLPWTHQIELKTLRRQAEAFFRANPGPLVRLSRKETGS